MNNTKNKSIFGLTAEKALKEAVKKAVSEHKRKGIPIVSINKTD